MTLSELEAVLRDGGIREYRNEALLLFGRHTGLSSARLVADKNVPAPPEKEKPLMKDVKERLSGRPLQYIFGSCCFMGYDFEVNESVLVPRQETELLVSLAAEKLPRGAYFADLCTGSGCIAVSLLKKRPDTTCTAVDKYPDALSVAAKNAAALGTEKRISFLNLDVTEPPPEDFAKRPFDAVLANPPYISRDEYETLDNTVKHEPRHALTDEKDGLFIAEKILENYIPLIKSGGFLAMEIGYNQGDGIKNAARALGQETDILKDYSGNDRIAFCRI